MQFQCRPHQFQVRDFARLVESQLLACQDISFTHHVAPSTVPVSQSCHRHYVHIGPTFTSAIALGSSMASRSSGTAKTHKATSISLRWKPPPLTKNRSIRVHCPLGSIFGMGLKCPALPHIRVLPRKGRALEAGGGTCSMTPLLSGLASRQPRSGLFNIHDCG